MLLKSIILYCLFLTLSIQFCSSDGGKDDILDKQIAKMWERINADNKIKLEDMSSTLHKSLREKNMSIKRSTVQKIIEHFKNVEEEARTKGILENISLMDVDYKIYLNEFENANFSNFLKENIANQIKDEKTKDIIYPYIDICCNLYISCLRDFVKHLTDTSPVYTTDPNYKQKISKKAIELHVILKKYVTSQKDEAMNVKIKLSKIGKTGMDIEHIFSYIGFSM